MIRTAGLLLAVVLGMAACGSSRSSEVGSTGPDFEVPRDADGVETWDLRSPPTAEDVGLPEGEIASIHSSSDPRRVRVLLPEGRTIDAEVTTVSFDNFVTRDGSQDPTNLILHDANRPFESALQDLRGYLDQLGITDDVIDSWREEVEASPDRRPIEAGDQTSVGYVDVSVGGRYKFESGNASLTWAVGWGQEITGRPVPATVTEDPVE